MGQAEHHMEVWALQKLSFPGRDPTLSRLALTLGTMPVTARVKGESPVLAASQALVDMAAQRRCAAILNRAHHVHLLKTDSVLITIDEVAALRAKDVGHLHGGPRHGFWFLLDRFTLSSFEIERASTGLTTACK
jgi:hypothetical protein